MSYIKEAYMRETYNDFIKTQHPIGTVQPTNQNIVKWMTEKNWLAQAKINGRKAQIHLYKGDVTFYTRHGTLHTANVSKELIAAIKQWFTTQERTVIEAEFIPQEQKIYVFDLIMLNGIYLRDKTYPERHTLLATGLPNIMAHIQILPMLTSVTTAQKLMASDDKNIEGLVFKSKVGVGFSDNFIIRCRKVS
jgi:ATP-dependent DNA ligase